MPSAKAHPQPVQDYVWKECRAGRILGPLPGDAILNVQVSRFGVIPKSTPGKWRLILVLSFPEGGSVNDGILRNYCHLQLASVDYHRHGPGHTACQSRYRTSIPQRSRTPRGPVALGNGVAGSAIH